MARLRITISTEPDTAEAILNALYQMWRAFPDNIPGGKKTELRHAMLLILFDMSMKGYDLPRLLPIATAIDYAGWVQAGGLKIILK